jgi:phosphatidylglycerol:prolipoprotein diacylglycerol transferase
MHPRLIEIPFLHLTLWSFGAMMVLGFLAGLFVMKRLCRRAGLSYDILSNATLYALLVGIVGARIFFVIHHRSELDGLLSMFAIWRGGLELLGGAIPAVLFILWYLHRHKLPVRRCLDILAIALMIGLAFGRIGCFLNGCCFGKLTDLPWGLHFPYDSYVYHNQIYANPERDRTDPYLPLPESFFGYETDQGEYLYGLKPWDQLTPEQKTQVSHGPYQCLPVHPTQLYSSACAAFISFVLYLVWRYSQRTGQAGLCSSLMLILYGIMRISMEYLRDDNPYEMMSLTISQLLSLGLVVLGIVLSLRVKAIK